MFEMLEEYGNENGSERRFHQRIARFRQKNKSVFVHHFWWVVHNCVAHVLIGLFPLNIFFRFHDWTSEKINVSLYK